MANLGFEFRASIPWLLDFGLAYIDNHSRLSNSSVSDQNYREFQGRINLLWDFKP
jgi:hypothetical protein